MASTDLSNTPGGTRRIGWFLDEQRAAGVAVDRGEFFSTREEEGIVIAAVATDHLGQVTTPDSAGSRFRLAAFELALECVHSGKPLVLDLSEVKGLNMESVFTLLDMYELFQGAKLGFMMSGINERPGETLELSRARFWTTNPAQSIAATPEEAVARLRSERNE